ncbi:hypothetical protein XELAEV_18001066mg [Xenopus laevis]|nr:hypothetical protein XELAEV_18001066mg [Xenopus laevis]
MSNELSNGLRGDVHLHPKLQRPRLFQRQNHSLQIISLESQQMESFIRIKALGPSGEVELDGRRVPHKDVELKFRTAE